MTCSLSKIMEKEKKSIFRIIMQNILRLHTCSCISCVIKFLNEQISICTVLLFTWFLV
uniref:Uncharacterized protein n=1 Tax=Octopus bimaculoides TaxID=37653 RepID=A0A0L8FIV6_OCTBM